jgi:C-terminal binding protein
MFLRNKRYFHFFSFIPFLFSFSRLRGKKLGIIGFGKIGKAVGLRAKAFGLDVHFYDPYLEDGVDKSLGVKRFDTLQDLLQQSDVISVNCDLNKENYHMLNKQTLRWIPANKGVFLVNTARGGLIEEAGLLEALSDGRIKAAGIDVLEKEPYEGHLNHIDNLILTPHTAFYSDEGFVEMRTKATLEVARILRGEQPRNSVNKHFFSK